MRIAMFMPGLGPTALGWKVHRDFADAVERLGHSFALLTTPAPVERDAADNAPGTAGATTPSESTCGDDDEAVATVLAATSSSLFWGELGRPLLRTPGLLPAAGALAGHLRTHGDEIDLLHFEVAYPHAAAGALAISRSGWSGPVAVTPMGEDILVVRDRFYGMRRYPVPSWLVNRTLRRATALRCISPLAERQIAELSPKNARRVIPLNISDEATAATRTSDDERAGFRAAARAKLDDEFGTTGRPVVLSFGRLHPFKGVDYLVEAAAGIGDATVLIIGPSLSIKGYGDVATVLRRQAEAAGVADKVNVAGGVHPSRALEVLAAADVIVVPSPLESLNKVCMEAAAVGTPFIVTETTGVSAWVPEDGVGIVVPPRNAATISWAIDEILDGHFDFDAGEAARFAERFSSDRVAAEVMEFYEETTSGR